MPHNVLVVDDDPDPEPPITPQDIRTGINRVVMDGVTLRQRETRVSACA